ncbi:phytanoyl-CoA dioxygenase family protein [Tateyamaria pelophila]|uniref:phytanoyl-CoA dioxygenase family protein n=1 Tax=Tateyamaria pelophila TaxID=328415 RepID=UPI001CC143CA|nr:phytanoyl-CoA dioxygenase family protein [Tateyamaria pelophila]
MKDQKHHSTGYFSEADCDIAAFKALIGQNADTSTLAHADDVQNAIPIYDMARLRPSLEERDARAALMAEWAGVLMSGPGVLVLKGAYANTRVLDEATAIYEAVIAEEKQASGGGGDHFAASGANDRIWNSSQKLCLRAPDVFLRYFGNTAIEAVSEAWLGPNYQMTAQVNVVHPGGAAQQAHRDYHLGFQSAEVSAQYPAHVHDLTPALTLQGAVAHCDMPIESGPTKLLPFSQMFRAGYAAWRFPEFRACFEENYVQLPLSKGDALFFNPALFHAAGANTSADIHRMANLLQVSSAFGRAMETLDRRAMCIALYPSAQASALSRADVAAAIASCAEGYSFPTNLDSDPPIGGLAPETQKALFHRGLRNGMSALDFGTALDQIADRQRP